MPPRKERNFKIDPIRRPYKPRAPEPPSLQEEVETETHPDIVEAVLAYHPESRFITDNLIRGRRIVLRGIEIVIVYEGGKPVELQPRIPHPLELSATLRVNPTLNDVTYNPHLSLWQAT